VKKLIVLGAGAVGAATTSLALFGTGVAAADDYAGQSYSDASSAASDAGQTVVIASRVGNNTDDNCTVERSQAAPFVSSADFTHASDTVEFYLNCTAALAGPGVAGRSLASPEGRAEKASEEEKAAEDAAAAQQNETDELAGTDQSVGAAGDHH
jgi:hypothetical protein